MGKGDLNSMSAAVRVVIDAYPAGHEFHGNQLKEDVVKIYPDAKDMYPDTILRMARRHRRYAFCVVDQNNSLYKKMYVEPVIKEVIPEPPPTVCSNEPLKQLDLLFFAHCFLLFFLGLFFALVSGSGRPLFTSFIATKSSFLYMPAEPIYRNGCIPLRCNLLFTASEDIPKAWAISKTVMPSMTSSINQRGIANQVENSKVFRHQNLVKMCHFDTPYWVILTHCFNIGTLYCRKIFLKFFEKTLTGQIGFHYTVLMFQQWNNNKTATGGPGSRTVLLREAKGEFYERVQKFSGMA
jgi:hypothetical protein